MPRGLLSDRHDDLTKPDGLDGVEYVRNYTAAHSGLDGIVESPHVAEGISASRLEAPISLEWLKANPCLQ